MFREAREATSKKEAAKLVRQRSGVVDADEYARTVRCPILAVSASRDVVSLA